MPPFVPRKRYRSTSPASQAPPMKRAATSQAKSKRSARIDVLEPDPARGRTVEENQAYLNSLNENSDSSLSDISSDDFEDALPARTAKRRKLDQDGEADTADDMDWEDAISQDPTPMQFTPGSEPSGDLELTLDKGARTGLAFSKDGRKGPSKIERQIRIDTHRMHVQSLLFHNLLRNAWACDKEVQKILVEQLSEEVKKEVDRFRLASGLSTGHKPLAKETGKGKDRGKRKDKSAAKNRSQRDWAPDADALEEGAPNLSQGDPLLRLLKVLSIFWKRKFVINAPGLRKQGYKPLERLETELKSHPQGTYNVEEHGEKINDLEHFRQHAKKCEGSRDVGALLFTALLRGLGLEARLVANLQPVGFGWSKAEEAAPKRERSDEKPIEALAAERVGKDQAEASHGENNASSSEEDERGPAKKKDSTRMARSQMPAKSTPRIRRNTRPGGAKDAPIDLADSDSALSSAPDIAADDRNENDSVIDTTPATPRKAPISKPRANRYDRDLPLPAYWTEVLSPVTNKYIPVDPIVLSIIANTPELLASFEPRGAAAEKAKQILAYTVAYSADGTAKDVTVRYLKRHVWPGKTKGFRLPPEKVPIYNKRGKIKRYEEYDWFKTVIRGYARNAKSRTPADDIEEQTDLQPVKLQREQNAGEETLQGYKNSAEFVLARHLRREEAILATAKAVKTFTAGKGDKAQQESVYRRSDVVTCKTVESWHKEGREIRAGEQPLKYVPMRAVTLIRKREIEEAERDTGEKVKQGLYSEAQTDWIIPPPIVDGKIPKNAFGNMDVYVPTMVPRGAVHVRLKGAARVCRRLGIEFAEACTGFEFGRQRAVPVLTGVVVAVENKGMVVDAWRVEEEERRRKEEGKREALVLDTWKRFLRGLRVLERLREEHGEGQGEEGGGARDEVNPFVNKRRRVMKESQHGGENGHARDPDIAGGFLHADDASDVGGGGFLVDNHDAGGGFLLAQDDVSHTHSGGFILENLDEPRNTSPKVVVANGYYDELNPPTSQLTTAKDILAPQAKEEGGKNNTKPAQPRQRGNHVRGANAAPKRRNAARKSAKTVHSHYFERDSDGEERNGVEGSQSDSNSPGDKENRRRGKTRV